jgi:hypothetical protein
LLGIQKIQNKHYTSNAKWRSALLGWFTPERLVELGTSCVELHVVSGVKALLLFRVHTPLSSTPAPLSRGLRVFPVGNNPATTLERVSGEVIFEVNFRTDTSGKKSTCKSSGTHVPSIFGWKKGGAYCSGLHADDSKSEGNVMH